MTLSESIRDFVYERYIKPAYEKGLKRITLRAGDVHDEMGLKGKIPSVCGALGTKKFLKQYNLRLLKREGPSCSADVYFTYEIL